MASSHSSQDIANKLIELIAKKINKQANEVDTQAGFIELGLQSLAMVELIEELEATYGELPPTLLFDYPNIDSLADYIKNKVNEV